MGKLTKSFAVMAMMVAIVGCGPKNKPTPAPDPEKGMELKITEITRGTLIGGNKMVTKWTAAPTLPLWVYGGKLEQAISLEMKKEGGKWVLTSKPNPVEVAKGQKVVVAHLPESVAKVEVTKEGFTFTPIPKPHEVGHFMVDRFYPDALLGTADLSVNGLSIEMNSPYKQVALILENSPWEQQIHGISLQIDGVLSDAVYKDGGAWTGTNSTQRIRYQDKETWGGKEADTLYLALPIQQEKVTATIKYTNSNGEQTETITTEGNELKFTFVTETIVKPPLTFTIPIDTEYWKQANQEAYNLITSNYDGTLTEEQARAHGWVINLPQTDEAMHTNILYKDDINLLSWRTQMKKQMESKQSDWGFAIGLETLYGLLVEVYPPLTRTTTGGQLASDATELGRHEHLEYITAPAGKYRMVVFVSYPEFYAGEEMTGKWYKIPMLDALTGMETINQGKKEYRSRYLEPVPLHKSPYKDMDIVEVVDRTLSNNTTPRWHLGYLYESQETYNTNQPLNNSENAYSWTRQYKVGGVIGITTINNSNHQLKGAIIAKAEYLPMWNSAGQWRLELSHEMNWGKEYGLINYWTAWSYEVGRTVVTLLPNNELKVPIEINSWNLNKWEKEGGRGNQYLGPANFIHFYWMDEQGHEYLMHRVNYQLINGWQQRGYGNIKTREYFSLYNESSLQQPWGVSPEVSEPHCSNGFVI